MSLNAKIFLSVLVFNILNVLLIDIAAGIELMPGELLKGISLGLFARLQDSLLFEGTFIWGSIRFLFFLPSLLVILALGEWKKKLIVVICSILGVLAFLTSGEYEMSRTFLELHVSQEIGSSQAMIAYVAFLLYGFVGAIIGLAVGLAISARFKIGR